MQPYQNYWMNNYQQPMYPSQQINQQFQQNQQMQYMDQLNQLRMQQAMPTQGLMGRFVEDFNVITANDVPMDGNGAVFIKRDGSEIQVRNWTAQGTIATSVFKPVSIQQPKEIYPDGEKIEIRASEDLVAVIQKYFEDINKRFDELEKTITPLD